MDRQAVDVSSLSLSLTSTYLPIYLCNLSVYLPIYLSIYLTILRSCYQSINISYIYQSFYLIYYFFLIYPIYMIYLRLSHPILSTLSYLILSDLILSYLILSYLVLSYLILSYLIFLLLLSFFLSFYLSIYLYLFISIYIYLYLFISIYIYLYLFYIYFYLFLSITIHFYPISIYFYLFLSVSICFYLFLSISFYFLLFLSESWAKGPWKGFPLRKPLGMQLTVSAKVFSEMAKYFFSWLKFWRKFMYTCLNLHCKYLYLLFIMYVSFCKKLLGDFSRKFGESWRKMAFPRKLGGLNCGLLVSELADEGEQGPTS